MVAVPAAQGGVAGVGEKKWQRRRFNVAVAKYHVGFALTTLGATQMILNFVNHACVQNFTHSADSTNRKPSVLDDVNISII